MQHEQQVWRLYLETCLEKLPHRDYLYVQLRIIEENIINATRSRRCKQNLTSIKLARAHIQGINESKAGEMATCHLSDGFLLYTLFDSGARTTLRVKVPLFLTAA